MLILRSSTEQNRVQMTYCLQLAYWLLIQKRAICHWTASVGAQFRSFALSVYDLTSVRQARMTKRDSNAASIRVERMYLSVHFVKFVDLRC